MKIWIIIFLTITLLIPLIAFSQQSDSPIRSVDFENFKYPYPPDLLIPGQPVKTFTLRNGEFPETKNRVGMYFAKMRYGDVTGDGVEEAIVSLGVHTGGSAKPGVIYVYRLRKNRPKLLWYFYVGDRADGGLHNIYGDNGELVVELYGPKLMDEGLCCPARFTRTRYKWQGSRFRQKGRKEIILIPTQE